jgi:predicted 3-demethylubiquinone-9 3-methyltransferase (glyoxalase superfamily)
MTDDRLTTCLWFDGKAEEAANYYVKLFGGTLGDIQRWTEAGPGPAGSVITAEFEIRGQKFVGLNGGPEFHFSEAISFQIFCADQAEVDHYWSALTADGGNESQCGWCKDRYGLSWQIVPRVLMELISDPDSVKAGRTVQAMLGMQRLDIAALQRAYDGD